MTYQENQSSISTWASETFGEPGTLLRVLTRANEEMSELLRELTGDCDHDKVAREAADVLIVLFRVAERNGFRLVEYTPPKEYEEDGPFKDMAEEFALDANIHLAWAMKFEKRGNRELAAGKLKTAYLCLHSLCSVLGYPVGYDLLAEVDAKMAVNRTRVWKKDGTGHGYHVRDKSQSSN